MAQPGWYADPWNPALVRWFDGSAWTSWTNPADQAQRGLAPTGGPAAGGLTAAGPAPARMPVVDPRRELADEVSYGRWASNALIAGAVCYVVLFFVSVPFFSAYYKLLADVFESASAGSSTVDSEQIAEFSRSVSLWSLSMNLANLGLLLVGVLFLRWSYKAAQVGARAGFPARRSPGWAVAGFLIPIVSLWFPYQSTVDMFPVGHPGRAKVKLWWAAWIGMAVMAVLTYTAALFSAPLGFVFAALSSAVAVAAAIAARGVIAEVGRVHADVNW